MKNLLDGQVAVITGAGRGIGAATAKLFASHGAKIVISDVDKEPAQHVVNDICSAGGDAIEVCGDITDPAFPEQLVAKTIEKYGRLNILVNNAGFTWDGMLHKMTDAQFEAMLQIHNMGPFRLIRAASPYMRDEAKKEKAQGDTQPRCIINVSSTSGLHGNIGQVNYSTAKMGTITSSTTLIKSMLPRALPKKMALRSIGARSKPSMQRFSCSWASERLWPTTIPGTPGSVNPTAW